MQIFNALQTRAGAKTEYSKLGSLTQPTQFLPQAEKDEKWMAWNIDWLEYQGIKQVRRNSPKFLKNIRLSYGIIDRSDYIIDESNEYTDLVSSITKGSTSGGDGPLDLKFFPIIPNVIDILVGEFSKRVSKLQFRAVDDTSYNDLLEDKRQKLEDTLVRQAEQKLMQMLIEEGMDPNDPQAQQILSQDHIKSLPEIEQFYKKDYRSLVEEWCTHQRAVDDERFHMQEMEERQFRRSLIMDREFWHFRMLEDDYVVEEWDPVFTFYHKSPETRYISEGNFVGKVELMSIADVIDKYGYIMSEEQLRSLERIYPIRSLAYNMSGVPNDGSLYDGSKSWEWNMSSPSLGYRQMASYYDNWTFNGDIVSWLMNDTEDYLDFGNTGMIRVTTTYWKSQRKIGYLTKITDEGELIQDIVDESFDITCKPLYDTSLYTTKTKDNVVYGEHVDWLWINEVCGGVKIGANRPTSWMNEPMEINPIYLGINQAKPGRVPFQFKGDLTVYGCKLPVEGCVFSDRNTRSVPMIERLKPFQVGYNLVNNQISDILVDELGSVVIIDQNMLPKQSMGEDWGRGNIAKAFVAMKNFQIMPLDTTLNNTEGASSFNQFTVLNMEQTNRLMSRVQLANYFKENAMAVIGITPQRAGTIQASESATGVQQAVNNSYSQTEKYFTQHSDWLMPRVHQMRTDLAQYYHSTKASIRLQYVTSLDERVNFQINGTQLLSRDFNVFATTKVNSREILNQMKQFAIQNSAANGGASLYDLFNVIKSESVAEVTRAVKTSEEKAQAQQQAEMQQQQDLQQQMIEAKERDLQASRAFEADQNQRDREKDVTVAEIRAAGYPDTSDNGYDEYLDRLNFIEGQTQFRDTMQMKREQEAAKNNLAQQNLNLQHRKVNAEIDRSNKELQIARIKKAEQNKAKPPKKK